MDLGVELRVSRARADLTQQEVATGAGTSQTAVTAYEKGRKTPNIATLARLARAMGTTLSVELVRPAGAEHDERPVGLLTQQERRSLWLHRAIAARIQADPDRAVLVARENLATRRRADEAGRAETWRHAWEALLGGPLDVLLAALCSTSTYASQLRQTAPFAGLLTPQERWTVYRCFARAENRSGVASPSGALSGVASPSGALSGVASPSGALSGVAG